MRDLSHYMKGALRDSYQCGGYLVRHTYTGDSFGRVYVKRGEQERNFNRLSWRVSVPVVKALRRRDLVCILESSGSTAVDFRPELLRLNAQGAALACMVIELGITKSPDWYTVEPDGTVVYGDHDSVKAYEVKFKPKNKIDALRAEEPDTIYRVQIETNNGIIQARFSKLKGTCVDADYALSHFKGKSYRAVEMLVRMNRWKILRPVSSTAERPPYEREAPD